MTKADRTGEHAPSRRADFASTRFAAPSGSAAERGAHAVRALFVVNSLNVGGSETKTVRVVNSLLGLGFRAGIAYLNEPSFLLESLNPNVPRWNLNRCGKFSFNALRRLRSLIWNERPNVVLAVNLYPALYVSLAAPAAPYALRTVASINTSQFPARRAWLPMFYRPFLQRFDHIVYGCESQRSAWLPRLRCRTRSVVIYNGVDIEHFAPARSTESMAGAKRRLGIAPDAFVIGAVGRLAPEKNHEVLIDATTDLRRCLIDAHLLLVGDGDMRRKLEERAAEEGISAHVTFAGMQSDVRLALSAIDVFVLPSTHVETFSNAALEAMAMGIPVVLSRIGGAQEMIEEGVEGVTLSTEELAERLTPTLVSLQRDASQRERMGRAARERVVQQFSFQGMVEQYAALIDDRVRPIEEQTP
ncbi:MAG TPA: glycosyltransferase [Steroidobacter sp.]|nr:glycosyltransferase [Steroidobacter sp.]